MMNVVRRALFHTSARRLKLYDNVDSSSFKELIANKEKVVIVDFFADWCGPCKALSPLLEKHTQGKTGSGLDMDLVTVDTDEQHTLSQEHQVRALPTVIAFKDGKPIKQFVGALPEPKLKEFFGSL